MAKEGFEEPALEKSPDSCMREEENLNKQNQSANSDNGEKRFLIKFAKTCTGHTRKQLGDIEYVVSYNQMSQQLRNIKKIGGKIISIIEII